MDICKSTAEVRSQRNRGSPAEVNEYRVSVLTNLRPPPSPLIAALGISVLCVSTSKVRFLQLTRNIFLF